MTPEEIKERVKRVRALSLNDFEAAHAAEIDMLWDLVRAVAKGKCPDPEECCVQALRSRRIKFARVLA